MSTFTVNTSALFVSRIITDFLALRFLLKAVAGLCLLLELDAARILTGNMGGRVFFHTSEAMLSLLFI